MSSSKRWLNEHITDKFVKQAQKDGYRSRSAYKLLEIISTYKVICAGNIVLDLGASPGGWSQVAIAKTAKNGIVIANDILPMKQIKDVNFICGDFTDNKIYEKIIALLNNKKINVVLSDMAPNFSGQAVVDIPKAFYLAELALDIAVKTLYKNGFFLVKIFHGIGFDDFIKQCRINFNKVIICKPKASRNRSKEVYLLASILKK